MATHKILTPSAERVLRAVGRLYRSKPGVVLQIMKKRKGGVYRGGDDCYLWYREKWMTEILNAYRVMMLMKKRRSAPSQPRPQGEK